MAAIRRPRRLEHRARPSPSGGRSSRIANLERLAARAWPAAEQVALGPWTLRATEGVTSRANSVLPVPPQDHPLAPAHPLTAREDRDVEGLIEEAERFYRRRGLPAIVQLAPAAWPDDLDARLRRRGWRLDSPSEVWTALAHLVDERCPHGEPAALLAPRAEREWLDFAYAEEPSERRAVRAGIVGRIAAPTAFALLTEGARVVACGFAVAEAGWAGVFSMRTLPEVRGRGFGTRILGALARWARARSARQLYLQVDATNAPAHGLYRKSGFARAYRYHFRVAPDES